MRRLSHFRTEIKSLFDFLYKGQYSFNYYNGTSGQEELFFCLRTVPIEISRQTYDTPNVQRSSPWTVTVS